MDKFLPSLGRSFPDWLEPLMDLAMDLRWTWNHGGDYLWKSLDAATWEKTQNPWWILQSIPYAQIEQLSKKPEFSNELQKLIAIARDYLNEPGWFNQQYSKDALGTVAYYSMEFGLGEVLPLYAGGLGILAGDFLKTASDLTVPLVGVGLLYQEGYFRQILGADGWQIESYPHNDPTILPIRPVMDTSGGWLRIPLELPGRTVLFRVWQVEVARVMLYLLDSNDPMNSPADRAIIYKLYDDNPEFRLIQEMVLGICGWRLVQALKIPVEICHLNEGHAAFLILERARSFMHEVGCSFSAALWATRAGNVFTTHTPVAAGFDTFAPDLIAKYFAGLALSCGITIEQLLALGRPNPDNDHEHFNITTLAMRGSIAVNGVSKLHGEVSRRIFQPLFPRWPEHEVPVNEVTNGIHTPSWDSKYSDELWNKYCGQGLWYGTTEHLGAAIQNCSDREIWELRTRQRQDLVLRVREILANQYRNIGADPDIIEGARHVLDPNLLTIGFARRFTDYKRPDLILHDRDRLIGILNHAEHPVQMVVAGKSHPKDQFGKYLIKQFIDFARQQSCRHRVVFLPDYDIAMAQQLVQGVDLWINTPRRPWEACGTSGMKVLVNGGLNVSELDGWWAEAYSPELGWAIGDGREHSEPEWDAVEAEQLYDLLENQVVPEFYNRDASGIPVNWVKRIRTSMSRLTPYYSSNRMVRQYVEKIYLPCVTRLRQRLENKCKLGRELDEWEKALARDWAQTHFGNVTYSKADGKWKFQAQVYLGELNPDYVAVELYADRSGEFDYVHQQMKRKEKLPGAISGYSYEGAVDGRRPAEHFTVRIVPFHPEARIPLEENHIKWQTG